MLIFVRFSKHRQNLINLERNMGKQAFNDVCLFIIFNPSDTDVAFQGAEIMPMANYSAPPEKRQAEKLTDENSDEYWAGPITIGTPGKAFLIDFDSESRSRSMHCLITNPCSQPVLRTFGSRR